MPRARERSSEKRTGRPRIALLAGYLNEEYVWAIWRGVRETVEQRGGSVVCIAGAGINDPSPDRQARSELFELAQPAAVDGILCLSGVLGHFAGVKGTESWLLKRGLLAACIGPAEHVPSVSIDDETGVTQLMHHLIEHHGYRRIAFITGISTNEEARRRLGAYERALVAHGLPHDPRLILHGEFTTASGSRAVAELFDRRQLGAGDLDAIFASNDCMAFGAADELTRRRIAIPDQIAVVGFDDIQPARVHRPSLTTVRQPLEQLGQKGATRLLDLLDGQAAEGAIVLDTELVLRRSCGCLPTDVPPPLDGASDFEETTLPGRTELASNLELALIAELHGAPGTFERALEPHLRRAAGGNAQRLEDGRRFAEELATRLGLAREDLVHQRLSRLARVLHTRMFGPQALLSTALAELLPDFGVDECAVSELVEGTLGAPNARLKFAFGFDAHTIQPQMSTFEARQLVPSRFEHLRNRSVFVLPLTCGPQTLGIAVLPASGRDGSFYETLAELFSTILKVLELRRQAERSAKPLRT
jgi:DNA-binding LacI/PurR family transcriptional regulator